MKNVPFKGIIAYPITPFDKNEKVDIPFQAFGRKADHFRKAMVSLHWEVQESCLICLTKKKEEVTEATLQQVKGIIPTLVGFLILQQKKQFTMLSSEKSWSRCGNDYPDELLEADG